MTPPARTAGIVPLTADDRRLHLTVSKRFLAKLAEARDALSHSLPGASEEQLLEAGLDLLLVRAAKRRGVVEKPQKKLRPSKPEHPAAHVRREVWKRDGGRCQWRLANGEICGSTHRLQLDHIVPLARGGTSTSDNTRLLCGRHNLESARIELGAEWMDQWAPRVRKRPASSPDSERPPIKS